MFARGWMRVKSMDDEWVCSNKKWLNPQDSAIVLTIDGKFRGICAHDKSAYYEEADAIQEFMTRIMKEENNRIGGWLWHINKKATKVYGEFLGDTDIW